jgi:hypothetical protein
MISLLVSKVKHSTLLPSPFIAINPRGLRSLKGNPLDWAKGAAAAKIKESPVGMNQK